MSFSMMTTTDSDLCCCCCTAAKRQGRKSEKKRLYKRPQPRAPRKTSAAANTPSRRATKAARNNTFPAAASPQPALLLPSSLSLPAELPNFGQQLFLGNAGLAASAQSAAGSSLGSTSQVSAAGSPFASAGSFSVAAAGFQAGSSYAAYVDACAKQAALMQALMQQVGASSASQGNPSGGFDSSAFCQMLSGLAVPACQG